MAPVGATSGLAHGFDTSGAAGLQNGVKLAIPGIGGLKFSLAAASSEPQFADNTCIGLTDRQSSNSTGSPSIRDYRNFRRSIGCAS